MPAKKLKHHFDRFWQAVLHPSVFVFLLLGAGVIFLTFLTNDNALEIAIAGAASVFIGIGVNNYSALETRSRIEQKRKEEMRHFTELLQLIKAKAIALSNQVQIINPKECGEKVRELAQLLALCLFLFNNETAAADGAASQEEKGKSYTDAGN